MASSKMAADKYATVLPSAETAAMLLLAWLASRQNTMRKVDGWQTTNPQVAKMMPITSMCCADMSAVCKQRLVFGRDSASIAKSNFLGYC